MSSFRVVGLVGLQAAGKTEIARVFSDFGIPCVRMGDVVIEEVRRRGLEVNEKTVGWMADELRREQGDGVIARLNIPRIQRAGTGKRAVVVDGIRGIAEVEEFRKAFGESFVLCAVLAPAEQRFARVSGRRREDDAASFTEFLEKDRRELSWGMGDAIALADIFIVNDGTLEELRGKAVELFRRTVGEA